jgi:23S rRNA pseudouridine1911/1915/1917 synthase
MKTLTFSAPHSARLDQLVAAHLDTSRSQACALIRGGHVQCGDRVVTKPAFKPESEATITITLPDEQPASAPLAVDFEVTVLYEDEHLLVVNKPAGVVIHEAASHKGPTLVDWLKLKGYRLSTLSGEERHGIVHRIDKETTGALVVAKTDTAHRSLSDQLVDRTMGRYYLAIIDCPLKENTIVDAPIGRHPTRRTKMTVRPGQRPAKSAFIKLAELSNNRELIAAKLFSGRTHQIRVHLQHLGRHIIGDGLYGYKGPEAKIEQLFLHARLLYLRHPVTGAPLEVEAPLHAPFKEALKTCKTEEPIDEILTAERLRAGFDAFLGVC